MPRAPVGGDAKWKNALVPFYSISFCFVYLYLCHPFPKKISWEVELFEQRPSIHAGQGRSPGAAVLPGGLAPQPRRPVAGSEHLAGPRVPTAKAAPLLLPLAGRTTVSVNHPDACMHGQHPAVILSILASCWAALLF